MTGTVQFSRFNSRTRYGATIAGSTSTASRPLCLVARKELSSAAESRRNVRCMANRPRVMSGAKRNLVGGNNSPQAAARHEFDGGGVAREAGDKVEVYNRHLAAAAYTGRHFADVLGGSTEQINNFAGGRGCLGQVFRVAHRRDNTALLEKRFEWSPPRHLSSTQYAPRVLRGHKSARTFNP